MHSAREACRILSITFTAQRKLSSHLTKTSKLFRWGGYENVNWNNFVVWPTLQIQLTYALSCNYIITTDTLSVFR